MKLPLVFDMTTTRPEFRRLLPAAVGHAPFAEVNGAFVHADGARRWRIELEPLPRLSIGLIRLECHRVGFDFRGYSAGEIADFMARFELHFRRGGG